jgi:hypothetical protein
VKAIHNIGRNFKNICIITSGPSTLTTAEYGTRKTIKEKTSRLYPIKMG